MPINDGDGNTCQNSLKLNQEIADNLNNKINCNDVKETEGTPAETEELTPGAEDIRVDTDGQQLDILVSKGDQLSNVTKADQMNNDNLNIDTQTIDESNGGKIDIDKDLSHDNNCPGELNDQSENLNIANSEGSLNLSLDVCSEEAKPPIVDPRSSDFTEAISTNGGDDDSSSLSEKFMKFGKALSPPLNSPRSASADVLDDRKPFFSSLTNLANRMMELESKKLTYPKNSSLSLSDLDKIGNHGNFSSKSYEMSSEALSTYSESEDYSAYDKIKEESLECDNESEQSAESIYDLQKKVKKLEYELDVANGTIKHVYDESTKKIKEVSDQYEVKIKNIDKQFIETIKQKDILKQSLDECMDARKKLQSNKENLIKSMSNLADENERLRAKLNMSTEDCVKLSKEIEQRKCDVNDMKKQLKKAQDDLSSATIKVQWANTKLKSEVDAHQLTRTKLAGMDAKIREAKEESNMIRANCQALIDKYQNSEEIQSNALSSKLEKLQHDFDELKKVNCSLENELDTKTADYNQLNKSNETIKDQLFEKHAQFTELMKESQQQENEKLRLANQLEDLDERLNSYNELKNELKNAYQNNQKLDETISEMREKMRILEDSNNELSSKEKDNLNYFQRVSSRDAELQLQVNQLTSDLEVKNQNCSEMSAEISRTRYELEQLQSQHQEYRSFAEARIQELVDSSDSLQATNTKQATTIEDLKNSATIAKRKHQADSRDLVRQIEQFRKQFERQEESMRRTESVNSIDSAGKKQRSGASSETEETCSQSNDSGHTLNLQDAMIMLTRRLHSLQSRLAKRQEKLDFCEGHIDTLTGEVQKKSRIIQSLLLRVETGERVPSMGEFYKPPEESSGFWGTSSSNGTTLKLSQEINNKLQQVLEDTLYKNITLKENIKTLGDEIDRLNKR